MVYITTYMARDKHASTYQLITLSNVLAQHDFNIKKIMIESTYNVYYFFSLTGSLNRPLVQIIMFWNVWTDILIKQLTAWEITQNTKVSGEIKWSVCGRDVNTVYVH